MPKKYFCCLKTTDYVPFSLKLLRGLLSGYYSNAAFPTKMFLWHKRTYRLRRHLFCLGWVKPAIKLVKRDSCEIFEYVNRISFLFSVVYKIVKNVNISSRGVIAAKWNTKIPAPRWKGIRSRPLRKILQRRVTRLHSPLKLISFYFSPPLEVPCRIWHCTISSLDWPLDMQGF